MVFAIVASCVALPGQMSAPQDSQQPAPGKAKHSRYLTVQANYAALLPAPPAAGSPQQVEDLRRVHLAENLRTPAQVAQARADDVDESMFALADAIGTGFRADALPRVAALSAHLRNESGSVNPQLKLMFSRPRPFVVDRTLHPVCAQTASNSYPSGHAMVGYLQALTLAAMLPERKDAILARGQQFAANRVVCGVHYPSDLEASHTVAVALFGALETSPAFQAEVKAAEAEVRAVLATGGTGAAAPAADGSIPAPGSGSKP